MESPRGERGGLLVRVTGWEATASREMMEEWTGWVEETLREQAQEGLLLFGYDVWEEPRGTPRSSAWGARRMKTAFTEMGRMVGEAGCKGNTQYHFRRGSFKMSARQVEMPSSNLPYKFGGNKSGVPGSGTESCGLACIAWRGSAVRKDSALELPLCL